MLDGATEKPLILCRAQGLSTPKEMKRELKMSIKVNSELAHCHSPIAQADKSLLGCQANPDCSLLS
jgi:hypothetical protein